MSMDIELENMDYAVCGIKTAGLISGLVLGTGEAIRHREVITPNRSGLDKRTSRTHFRKKKKKKKSKQRSGWQLSDSGGSTRSSDEAFVMRVEQRG